MEMVEHTAKITHVARTLGTVKPIAPPGVKELLDTRKKLGIYTKNNLCEGCGAREVCAACGSVRYRNPTTVVGCVVEEAGRVLLCRRAIEPGHGLWTLPAGFLELDEGLVEGARRETREEACVEVDVRAPHAFLDMPHIGQGYALFRARLRPGETPRAGDETLETAFVAAEDLPWAELAFPSVSIALRLWAETWLRIKLPLSRVKNIQAACTLVGFVPLFFIGAISTNPPSSRCRS